MGQFDFLSSIRFDLFSGVMNITIFALHFWFLSLLFTPRYSRKVHLAICAAAVLLGRWLILFWERLPGNYNYAAYSVNFLLVDAVFAAVALREHFLVKLTGCAFFTAVWVQATVVQMTMGKLLSTGIFGFGLRYVPALVLIYLVRRFRMRGQLEDEPISFSLVVLVSSAFSFLLAVHSNNQINSDLTFVLTSAVILLVMNLTICILCLKLRGSILRWKLAQSIRLHQTADTASVKEYDEIYSQMQIYRHEMRNHLQVIAELARRSQYKELESYLERLDLEEKAVVIPVNSGNALINAVLQQKLGRAGSLQIPVTVSAKAPEKLDIDETELCAFLANLLDNAIEASQPLADPRINILIKPYKGYLRIDISNRVDRDILRENPQLATSKQEPGHGIGMNIIRQIDGKYGGMLEFRVEGGFFHAKTMLKIIPNEPSAGE